MVGNLLIKAPNLSSTSSWSRDKLLYGKSLGDEEGMINQETQLSCHPPSNSASPTNFRRVSPAECNFCGAGDEVGAKYFTARNHGGPPDSVRDDEKLGIESLLIVFLPLLNCQSLDSLLL